MLRHGRKLLCVVVMSMLSVGLTAGTAHAGTGGGNSGVYGTTFVDGAGVLTNDFGDHANELGHSLCNGCSNSQGTDLVVMWQSILYAEGLLRKSDIDGYFGSRTATATKEWQGLFNLSKDGKVGPRTWDAADSRLRWFWSIKSKLKYDAKNTSGHVSFMRGDFDKDHDGGGYLLYTTYSGASGSTVWFDSSSYTQRIHFYKRTIKLT